MSRCWSAGFHAGHRQARPPRGKVRDGTPTTGRDFVKLVQAWLKIPFWQRVVAGFVLGALAGWALGPRAETWSVRWAICTSP